MCENGGSNPKKQVSKAKNAWGGGYVIEELFVKLLLDDS